MLKPAAGSLRSGEYKALRDGSYGIVSMRSAKGAEAPAESRRSPGVGDQGFGCKKQPPIVAERPYACERVAHGTRFFARLGTTCGRRPMFQLFALALASQAAPAPLPFVAKPCASPQAAAHATCGTVSVQEDRARPGARRIDLNVIVIHAKNPRPVRLALFDIHGGPALADTEIARFHLTEGPPD